LALLLLMHSTEEQKNEMPTQLIRISQPSSKESELLSEIRLEVCFASPNQYR